PCHRVVNREGRVAPGFAFGGEGVQRQLLEAEGIVFEPDGKIDLDKYGMKVRCK
ncbi:MAG: MGMT family protein, partial [Clostridia bacterium]|nr:MGMT family protein [Clostridia bacterium]